MSVHNKSRDNITEASRVVYKPLNDTHYGLAPASTVESSGGSSVGGVAGGVIGGLLVTIVIIILVIIIVMFLR